MPRLPDGAERAAGDEVRVGEVLPHAPHPGRGEPVRDEVLDERVGRRPGGRPGLDAVVERSRVPDALGDGAVVLLQLRCVHRLHQPREEDVAAHAVGEVRAVGTGGDARRHARGVPVAVLAAHRLAVREGARGRLLVDHGEQGVEGGDVDVRALAGALPLVQRGTDAGERVHRGVDVGERRAEVHRRPALLAGQRHQPGPGLGDQPEAGQVRVGALGAEGRQRTEDRARVAGVQHLPAEAEPAQHPRREVLDHDVGPVREPQRQVEAARVLEVQPDRPLAGVVLDVRAGDVVLGVADGHRQRPHQVAGGLLDADHVGAHVREHPRAERPGDHVAEVEDLQPRVGTGHGDRTSVGARVRPVAERSFSAR